MVFMLGVLFAITIIGFLVVIDRRDRRSFEDAQAHRLERAGLIQRIQDPEVAVATFAAQQFDPPVEPDRDVEPEYPGSM